MAKREITAKTTNDNFNLCKAPQCGRPAKNTGLCGMHYQRFRLYASYDLPKRQKKAWVKCSIEGCVRLARTRLGRHCEMHYYRNRRNGNFDAPVWGKEGITSHGYVMRRDLEHPVSAKNGYLYKHREVLYGAIGPGAHKCFWCGVNVHWGSKFKPRLVVDHLDGDKLNNSRGNLVPACNPCNSTRGLFQKWVIRHKDDPFLRSLFEVARASA